ncbi:unnamed protein product [Moneuplotes crassus]|uniref:Uncharacterized protein n=1 Tax=Euplotes crassus TaxID=5936 RepID=A0AAD1XN89_EUPCR|nr:unnamed protein product [Moneuplotes crassus]
MNICDYSTTQKATRKTKHIIQNSKMISQRIFHAHRGSLESKIKKLKKMQLKTGFYIPNKFNPGIKLKVFNPLRIHKSTSEPRIEDESLSPAMPVNKSIKIALKQKYLLFQAPGSKKAKIAFESPFPKRSYNINQKVFSSTRRRGFEGFSAEPGNRSKRIRMFKNINAKSTYIHQDKSGKKPIKMKKQVLVKNKNFFTRLSMRRKLST